ncbi:MAG TPA: hypothetical protein VF785_05350 [Gemmatimonadaceae bacterium]
MRMSGGGGLVAAVVAVSGGLLVVIGAVLPWMSLFAGLQRYSGMAGLYGRLAFAGGVLAIAGGVAIARRPDRRLRAGLGGLGVMLTLFAGWILYGLRSTTRALGQHPFLIARPGPGLYVVFAGALVVAALLVPYKRRI